MASETDQIRISSSHPRLKLQAERHQPTSPPAGPILDLLFRCLRSADKQVLNTLEVGPGGIVYGGFDAVLKTEFADPRK